MSLSQVTYFIDAERSVSQYTLVNAPQQCQNFTNQNLALHAMMVFSAIDVNPCYNINACTDENVMLWCLI